jgi:hypothetical protein
VSRRRHRSFRIGRRRAHSGWREAKTVTASFVGGLVVGALVWSIQMRRHRRELFSSNRLRRFAALGFLAGRPSVETAQLLTEYIRWEPLPALRRRAERLLGRMKIYLE